MNDLWIILTASLVAMSASILGTFLLLRKMSMVGDAISHSVLPGIALAYWLSGDKSSVWLLPASAAAGVVVSLLIDFLTRKAGIQSDAAIGISYTCLFAIGMIMISGWMKGNTDIDQECVLYGDIAFINLDKIIVDGNLYLGPRAFYTVLVGFVLIVAAVAIGFKGFKLLSFSEEYAISLGINTRLWHYILMALVSILTVVSFEVVGAVLVIGFMVIPPATAKLLTHGLVPMLVVSCLIGVISATVGYLLAVWLDVSITGAMVVISGVLFFGVMAVRKNYSSATIEMILPQKREEAKH